MNTLEMKTIMQRFFADIQGVCGTEKTFHAAFYSHLLEAGLEACNISREMKLNAASNKLVDFALYDSGSGVRELSDVLEFKGGAYNARNALHDCVRPGQNIKDLEKLKHLCASNARNWFVCIDLPELGTALKHGGAERVAVQAVELSIGFIYFNAGSNHFLFMPPSGKVQYIELVKSEAVTRATPPDLSMQIGSPLVAELAERSIQVLGSEDNYIGQLYSVLRKHGAFAKQVALETYFSLATVGQSRMQLRPDLTLFDHGVDGRFNLYRHGVLSQSNDAIKLKNLQLLVELKGGSSIDRQSKAQVAQAYEKDIVKLGTWRKIVHRECLALAVSPNQAPQYVFIGIDNSKKALESGALVNLYHLAERNGVTFHYIYCGRIH